MQKSHSPAAEQEAKRREKLPIRPKSAISDLLALLAAFGLAGIFVVTRWNLPAYSLRRWGIAFGLTSLFAVAARVTRGVDWSGALAGWAVAFVLAATGLRLFVILLLVFAVTLAATRTGKRRKQELRTAEAPSGRTAAQVMANLGVAMLIIVLGFDSWMILALAALAEAAADTSSSEIGMAFPGRTVLLTTGRTVASGIDGGVSAVGSFAAVAAGLAIAVAALALQMVQPWHALIVVIAGMAGMLFDSLLGALFERKGYLNNDAVNLLGTAFAVGVAYLMAQLLAAGS
jgi:uncharacterized protein (TIGR00297 family)